VQAGRCLIRRLELALGLAQGAIRLAAELPQGSTGLLDHLSERGLLEEDTALASKWHEALALLRERGFKERPLPGELPRSGVSCPSCSSLLRNVAGEAGDRCDWCGYVFPLTCPACGKELEDAGGEAGSTCLWCQHHF